jgi:hypothetical protein
LHQEKENAKQILQHEGQEISLNKEFLNTCVTQILWLQADDKSGFIIGLDPIPAQG